MSEKGLAERALFTELLDVLGRHRGWLVTVYLLILVGWFGLFTALGLAVSAESFHEVMGAGGQWNLDDDFGRWGRVLYVAGFLGLQALCIWGGGRVRLEMKPVKSRKLIISLVIFSALMALLTAGILTSLLEMTDRLGSEGSMRQVGKVAEFFHPQFMITMMLWSWIPWLIIGWVCVRNIDHHTALSRLVAMILYGSWVEFTVALPIDLATRTRTKDCPCASGSWFTLIFCLPVLLWSIGPAIYLLYLRERRLSEQDTRRARRILLAKSRRSAEA